MSRLATGIVAAALCVLGAVALADAVRGWRQDEPPPPATTTAPRESRPDADADADAIAALQEAELEGVLTYSDADCRLAALSLPDLEPRPAPRIESCEPHMPTGGIGVAKGEVVWAGLGLGVVQVVLGRDDLRRALRRDFGDRPYRALQAVTLADERLLVLVQGAGRGGDRLLAAFDGARLAWALPRWRIGRVDRVRASPRGAYFAVLDRERPGVRLFTREGGALGLPALTAPHAVAWSPDERWTAVATRASVWIFASEQPLGTAMRVPVRVRDLDWGT